MNPRIPSSIFTSLVVFACVACSHEKTTPPAASAPAPEPSATTTITAASTPKQEPSGTVDLSEEIVRACKIHFDDVDRAPKFDFDRSELRPADRDVLQQVARCVTTGPLAGRKLQLVGRADPRGDDEYNMVLGSHRANAAGAYLQLLGVGSSQLGITSRGKLDATGTDEAGWARDRRVDVILVH